MNMFIHCLSLDIREPMTQAYINVKKGDTARKLIFTFSNYGSAYHISDGCTAVFRAKKPDGTILFNSCTINGNAVEYIFTSQTVAAVGIVECEVTLADADGKQITSPRFALIVENVLYSDDEVESTNEFTKLQEALAKVSGLGSASIAIRVDGGYIQYSTDNGKTWVNLIAEADLKGTDGVTPDIQIGQVTTLEASADATASISGTAENPLLNLGIPKGADGAGMDITGAKVGQIAKIAAVDASGVPTAWEPVDMPSGGGAGELILDYIHDDSKFPPGRPAIHPIAYDADTKVWTSDGSIDLTTIAAAGTAVNGRYQINIIDPVLQINQEFDRTKWNPITTFVLTILSANTFSTGDYVPPVIVADWSKYIIISNETVTINVPSNASDKIRMVFDGQFWGATHYSTFGTTEWFDPNSHTTVSSEIGYLQCRGIYNHIVCDFDLENGKIYGTVSQAFVSYDKIGSAYGVYYPSAATTWPQIVLSRYANIGYSAMPYKGRLRIYNRG